jgi:hypothetical protein
MIAPHPQHKAPAENKLLTAGSDANATGAVKIQKRNGKESRFEVAL